MNNAQIPLPPIEPTPYFPPRFVLAIALLFSLPVLAHAQERITTAKVSYVSYCVSSGSNVLTIRSDGQYIYVAGASRYAGKVSVEQQGDLLLFGENAPQGITGHINLTSHQATFAISLPPGECVKVVSETVTTEDARCETVSVIKTGTILGRQSTHLTWLQSDKVDKTKPKNLSNDSPWTLNAKLSVLAFAGAATADCLSTGSLHENNPLLRSHGTINQAACFGLNGGVLALTIALQKKYPRAMDWLRWLGSGGHVAAAIHNGGQR